MRCSSFRTMPVIMRAHSSARSEKAALNITIWSYTDRLEVGALADPKLLPEPQRITAALTNAFEELRAAVDSEASAGTNRG